MEIYVNFLVNLTVLRIHACEIAMQGKSATIYTVLIIPCLLY
jgi:hypothetical protein